LIIGGIDNRNGVFMEKIDLTEIINNYGDELATIDTMAYNYTIQWNNSNI
jgi:hypothetical protein